MHRTSTDPLATHRAVLAVAGPQSLADITGPLSDADRALIDEALAAHQPYRALALAAVTPDGAIRDHAAHDELLRLHNPRAIQDPTLAAEVDAILARYGVSV